MTTSFLLYGSYGYTGSLIADLAVKNEMRPILSGRDAIRLKAQADSLGLEFRPILLDDRSSLEATLRDVPLILNCAGPFVRTFQLIVEACLRTGKHYVDITGEIKVFETLASRNIEARQAGVMLLPGMGFDVVPSDCLALHLKQRLPGATHLSLAISSLGEGMSRGTALTVIEGIPQQGLVRKDGKLIKVPLLWKTRQIDFGNGIRTAGTFPWGDVSTAFYSTGIPNIEEYLALPTSMMRMIRLFRPFIGLTAKPFMQRWLKQWVMRSPPGPSVEVRRQGRSRLWGEASDEQGQHVISRMVTPDGYTLTAETALGAVKRVLAGEYKAGFQTPSLAYGPDFILEFEGVQREEIL